MLFLSMLVLGAIAWNKIPVQLFPSGFDPPFLWIFLSYPNASPSENLDRIGIPVEDALWTIEGIKKIRTRARTNGCSIQLEFNQSVNMDVTYLNIKDRIERIKPELPDDLRYIYINRYSETDEPILYFGVSVNENILDPYRLIDEKVVKRLKRVDGVANVEMWGGNEKMVRIEFLLDRLKAHRIEIGSLVSELRNSNFALSAGILNEGGREFMVRAYSKIHDLEELNNLPIKGVEVRLSDVARVSYSSPQTRWIQRINGKEAIQMGVFKESGSNSAEITGQLIEVLEEISNDPDLSDLKFDMFFDQGKFITDSLNQLKISGLWGAFFALIVLFFFIRRVRMTLFITFAIPISLFFTVAVLYLMGWSLNVITLSGLMICVGLVVDNAIVVVENIQQYKAMGKKPYQAALKGGSEVALAITLATLTTAVVFLPLILMSGDRVMAFFMLRIGLPVIFALLASLMAALLFIPLAVRHFALSGIPKPRASVNRGSEVIGQIVNWVLTNRGSAIVILILLQASIAIPMKFVISTDEEDGNINDLQIRFRFPPSYSIARTDSVVSSFEDFLNQNSERYDIKAIVTGFNRNFCRMRVFLNEAPDDFWLTVGLKEIGKKLHIYKPPKFSREEIIEEIKEKKEPPPDVEMYTSWHRGRGEEDAVHISIHGEDTQRLLLIAEDVKKRLNLLETVISVETDLEIAANEVRIRFNDDQTDRMEVDPAMTAFGINSLIRGISLPDINYKHREISAQAELIESDRRTLNQVMNLPVVSSKTPNANLNDIASVSYGKGLSAITRENGRTRLRIKVVTTEDDLEKLSSQISSLMSSLKMPPGYEWGKGERFKSVEDASQERSQAWILAISFVLLLMGALFESFFLPLAIIMTIPFSFLGVWWLLLITGTQFGVMAGIGAIILIGVVVNNAIVLVDKANKLRKTGVLRNEALIAASKLRFRPILLTALTTITGLIPMAMGSASLIGIPYAPMGRAIIGGMLVATITTPVVVPLAYSLIDDFQIWMRSYYRSFIKMNESPHSNPSN